MMRCNFYLFYGTICLFIVPGLADPCYLCGNPDCTLDNPDAVISLPPPSPITEATCGEIMTYGLDGIIPSGMCGMTEHIRGTCGCNCPTTSSNNPAPTISVSPPAPTTPVSAPKPTDPVAPLDSVPPVGDSVTVTIAPTTVTDNDISSPGQAVLATETKNPAMDDTFNSTMNPSIVDGLFNSTNLPPTFSPSTVSPPPSLSPSLKATTQAPSLYSTTQSNPSSLTHSPTMTPTAFNGTQAPSTRFPDNTFFPTASSNAHDSRQLLLRLSSSRYEFVIVFGTTILCAISLIS